MMLYMLCFALLFVSFSEIAYTRDLTWKPNPNITTSPGCGFKKYTRSDYTTNTTSGIVQFIQRKYDEYHGPQWGPEDAILQYPWLDQLTLNTPETAATCNVVQQCGLIRSCSDMRPTPNSTDAEKAYAMLTGSEYFANWLNTLRESLISASILATAKIPSMRKIFTWDENIAGYRNWHEEEERKKLMLGIAIADTLFTLLSIASAQPELMGAYTMFNTMFTKTAVPVTIKGIENMSKEAARAALQTAARNIAGEAETAARRTMNRFKDGFSGLNAGSSGYANFGARDKTLAHILDGMKVPTRLVSPEDFESEFADHIAGIIQKLVSDGETLLRGNNITGHADDAYHLGTIHSTGNFADPVDYLASDVGQIFQNMFIANIIDTLWATQGVFVLMTDGKCTESHSGPDVNKICLEEYPEYTFWLSSIPKYEEMTEEKISSLDIAPGWHMLAGEGYAGVTQTMVVRSAVSMFMRLKKNAPLEHEEEARRSFINDPIATLTWTPARAGVFNVGVCYDPRGQFVSSLNIQEGRNFPCQCFPAPGANSSISYEENFAGFLDVTGFSTRRDYHQGCLGQKGHKDRQRCDEDRQSGKELSQWYRRTDRKYLNPKGRDQLGTDCYLETTEYAYKNCGRVDSVDSKENKNQCAQGHCKKKED